MIRRRKNIIHNWFQIPSLFTYRCFCYTCTYIIYIICACTFVKRRHGRVMTSRPKPFEKGTAEGRRSSKMTSLSLLHAHSVHCCTRRYHSYAFTFYITVSWPLNLKYAYNTQTLWITHLRSACV